MTTNPQQISNECLATLSRIQTVYILDGYDPTYTFLNQTWNICSTNFKTTPKRLVLLETLVFEEKVSSDDVSSYIDACNTLTQLGFCVRDISKFQPCSEKCGKAIVTKELYDHAKQKWTFLPNVWRPVCSACLDTKLTV